MNKSYRDILDSAASSHIPDNLNLFPRVAAWLNQRKTFMQTLRARPALAILLAFLALLLLTGVVYAIGRLTGYIPGIGMIDQSAPLRVLAEPVSVTRNGITITVTRALLSSDKTAIFVKVENVPSDAYPKSESDSGCFGKVDLRLTNGVTLEGGAISGGNWNAFEGRLNYLSVPADVNAGTLLIECIGGTIPGRLPTNWEIPIRFAPAPPDMTVMPIIEIQPTPGANTSVAVSSPLSIMKVLEIGDSYIVITEFNDDMTVDPSLPVGAWWNETEGVKLTDGNGNEILNYGFPNDIELPAPTRPNSRVWAYQISKNFTPPLTITYRGIYMWQVGEPKTFEFEFDTGPNPQPGQIWELNKDFIMDGYSIWLVSISADSQQPGYAGYSFHFESPDGTNLFAENGNALGVENVDITGYTSNGGGGGGGSISRLYETLPIGKLKVVLLISHGASGRKKDWQVQWSPEKPISSLYGISLKLDQFIPLDDGYYLIGHAEWTDDRIVSVGPGGWALRAYDSAGQEVPIEPAIFDQDHVNENLKPNQWAYHLYGKNFNGSLTLRVTQMSVEFKQPVKFTLDLRSNDFNFSDQYLGMKWKLGLVPLNVPGILANVSTATYVKEGDLRGFELVINTDPSLQGIGFNFESGLNTEGMSSIAGGGGSNRDDGTGLVLSTVMTNAQMSFPLVLSATGAAINGKWEVAWNPPDAEAGATPVYIPQACVTLDKWKQVIGSPEALPADLPQKVLLSRGALSPDPSLFISSLDGKSEQGLVFGHGSLSPDETKLVYSGADNGLYLLDISSGKISTLTNSANDFNPFWSADGTQIAFTRQTDKGANIFVMDANGKNIHALTDTTDNLTLMGWMPDGQRLIFNALRQDGNLIQIVNVTSGVIETLVALSQPYDGRVSISPDGAWIAYSDKVIGRMTPGIFISRLDGLEKKLLMQLEGWVTMASAWSADGKWLTVNVMDTNQFQPITVPALVNVDTCQVVPLMDLNGEIVEWVK